MKAFILFLISVSLVFSASANLATGVAIGVATDNLALGIAIGAAMEGANSSNSRTTVDMISELSDGRTQFYPEDAARLLDALMKMEDLSEVEKELFNLYGNESDVRIFIESLVVNGYLNIFYDDAGDYKHLVDSIRQVSGANKMQRDLLEENKEIGIRVEDSALKNVLEVQKGLGMVKFLETLSERNSWDLNETKDHILDWTSTELIDLRFDIKADNATLSEELADSYRAQFALQVLSSSLNILDDSFIEIVSDLTERFTSGFAYEQYTANMRSSVDTSTAGVILMALTSIGLAVTGGIVWMENFASYRNSFAYEISVFLASFIVPGALGAYIPYKIDSWIQNKLMDNKIKEVDAIFETSTPIKDAMTVLRSEIMEAPSCRSRLSAIVL